MKVTPRKVMQWVLKLKGMAGDDECAHSEEDAIHRRVLSAIAEGKCTDPAECSRLAISTDEIDFARWCA